MGETVREQRARLATGDGPLVLIACAKQKLERPAPAGRLYTSWTFRRSLDLARRWTDRIGILSAEHGLVVPAQRIAPYDTTLTKLSSARRRCWTAELATELLAVTAPGDTIVALAPAAYTAWAPTLEAEGRSVVRPLRGLGIGRQRQVLGQECASVPEIQRFADSLREAAALRRRLS